MIKVTDTIFIDENDLSEKFIRSSGPGGQNVNKVATAVQLSFDVAASSSLSAYVKSRLAALAGSRISGDGVLTIEADNFRTRERNREEALRRLVELVRKAAFKPKARKKTRPTKASQLRRLERKKARSKVKSTRGRVKHHD